MTAFDLCGPLPSGRVAIEASAGTGKTFTLAGLAARYVAEADVPIGEILIVTFTRAASAELRSRVRSRLVTLAKALEVVAATGSVDSEDDLERHLCATDVDVRLGRLRIAITDFDSATITTIHGFAQQALASLGMRIPTDPDARLDDDTDDLTRSTAIDLLAARALDGVAGLPKLGDLVTVVKRVVNNPAAVVEPAADLHDGSEAAQHRWLVDEVVDEVRRRRRMAGNLAYGDLLTELEAALSAPGAGAAVRRDFQRRFPVALIDEFQDTDPVQWSIFDSVFGVSGPSPSSGAGTSALVLVGDPKQAIYGFRGANVHTYLSAIDTAGTTRAELTTNWRSDEHLLDALGHVFDGVTFGDAAIAFHPVDAAPGHGGTRLTDEAGAPMPALSIRLANGDDIRRKKSGLLYKDDADRACFADTAEHIRRLLDTATVPDDAETTPDDDTAGPSPSNKPRRRLRPDDVAVLVRTGDQCVEAQRALTAAGIPAVMARGDDVFASPAAGHWHLLLRALARPSDIRRARAAALSWFVGWDAATLLEAGDDGIAELQNRLHGWADLLTGQGVAAMVGAVRVDSGVAARVLGRPGGDRAMTDLEHVAELLQLSAPGKITAPGLLGVFEQLMVDGFDEHDEADLAARRIESEDRAVQIMTMHVSKGLEFPVVCCPMAWSPAHLDGKDRVWWDADRKRRVIDAAPKVDWIGDSGPDDRTRWASEDQRGDNLRLLYVALTRAQHHCAVWWAQSDNVGREGLSRVLFARDDDGRRDPDRFADASFGIGAGVPVDADAESVLAPLVAAGAGRIEVVRVGAAPDRPQRWRQPPTASADLVAARLDRTIDRSADRWSFSTIHALAGDHQLGVGADPFDPSGGDGGAGDEPLPLGGIAGGAGFGTLVHEVLERVDFSSATLADDLHGAVTERLTRNPWDVEVDELVSGLMAAISSPLGPLFDGARLSDLTPGDRLDELTFDFTLGGAGAAATDATIGGVVLDHLDAGDPLRPWAERLAASPFDVCLRGHLTGSIDLIARVGGDRFVVSDYKTNRLAPAGTATTAALFHPDRLVDEMSAHDYPLQALLYSVALHRYLRWRLPDYDPDHNLGGIAYLFVRGMTGPGTLMAGDRPHGVFAWQPPSALIEDLSGVLAGIEVTA